MRENKFILVQIWLSDVNNRCLFVCFVYLFWVIFFWGQCFQCFPPKKKMCFIFCCLVLSFMFYCCRLIDCLMKIRSSKLCCFYVFYVNITVVFYVDTIDKSAEEQQKKDKNKTVKKGTNWTNNLKQTPKKEKELSNTNKQSKHNTFFQNTVNTISKRNKTIQITSWWCTYSFIDIQY